MINKKYLLLFALPFIAAVTGCEKISDFGDTNNNPAATNKPIVGALLTNVEAGIGGYASQTRGGLYAQYFSETQYTDVSLYSAPLLAFNTEYSGPLFDLQNIINTNTSNNQSVVARILQQYIYWTITDRWGDIPYSEALTGNPNPKYDTQEEIYKGMISTLKASVTQFDATSLITGDIIYKGNVSSWKKLANSLRMLMALRLSKRYPGPNEYAATEFKAALGDPAGHITINAENFTLGYPGGNFKTPWFNTYNGRKDFAESATMSSLLSSFSDSRQNAYGSSTTGVPYGLARAKAEAFTSANSNWAYILNPSYRTEASPVVVVGATHVLLARAEAADYGWTSDVLQTVYRNGITRSFEQWGVTLPGDAYFTQSNVVLTAAQGTGGNLRQIATQHYIAYYPNGLQGWSIWRKTGYPVLTPAPDATNASKQIPRRYTYGVAEYGSNEKATNEAVSKLSGGDTQDARVWWDK